MPNREPVTNSSLVTRRESAVPRGPFHVAPLFVSRAEGAKLWDVEGKEYIDFCGGIGVANVGHNHPKVVEAVKAQADRFLHTCWHVAMYEPYLELAERLNALVPIPGPTRTVFFNSGAEAVENAVKIARYATGRQAVVAFSRGFHGRTLLAMTMTGKVQPYSKGFGPFAPEVYRLPYEPFFCQPEDRTDQDIQRDVENALAHLFAYEINPEDVACLIVEPVLGEGGFLPIHPVAFRRLRELLTDQGILLIDDEVQCGFGRCGALFAIERLGVTPDLMTMAKSLAGGMPLSAVTGRADLMDAPHVGGIGGTYGGNPVACAAALAVLDVMAEENLPARAIEIGKTVMDTFKELSAKHPHVGAVHGLGAMCGLDVVDPQSAAPDPARTKRILAQALANGLLAMSASGNTIRTLMPLVIDDETLKEGLRVLSHAISATA